MKTAKTLVLVLASVLTFSFAACNGTPQNSSQPPETLPESISEPPQERPSQYPITQDETYLNEISEKYVWWLAPYTGILNYSWPTPEDIHVDALVEFCAAHNLLNLQRDEVGDYVDHHGPAERVEVAIQQYFDVPSEHLRTSRFYNPTDEDEQYIDEYEMVDGGGFGGADALNAEQDGDLLKITVGLYSSDGEPDRPEKIGLLTIKMDGDNFKYLSYELN